MLYVTDNIDAAAGLMTWHDAALLVTTWLGPMTQCDMAPLVTMRWHGSDATAGADDTAL